MSRSLRAISLPGITVALASIAGCDAVPAGFLNLFGATVTIEVVNDTRFTAKPEVFTSGGKNVLDDVFEETTQITSFGSAGAIEPNATATIVLPCNDGLELIVVGKAAFSNVIGLGVGEADEERRLRRDAGFDCGDVIRVRLSGSLFNFRSTVDVDSPSSSNDGTGIFGGNLDNLEEDIARRLDDLFD